MRHYFIDLENVRSAGLEGVLLLEEEDRVYVFYSDNAYTLTIPTLESINRSKAKVEYIKTNYIGSNAMDFQIVAMFGAMIEREKTGNFYIISHDNGFKSAVRFCDSYFNEYDIKLGAYATIISTLQLSDNVKSTNRDSDNAVQVMSGTAGQEQDAGVQKGDRKKRTNRQKTGVSAKKAEHIKNEDVTTAEKKDKLSYIYDTLSAVLSKSTIDVYAEVIHEGIRKAQNIKEIHKFFISKYGAEEGEALYRIIESDFENMKHEAAKCSRRRSRKK